MPEGQITDGGLGEETATHRLLVIACGALAREMRAVLRQAGMGHADLHALPAILHNRPERIAPTVEAALAERAAGYDRVFVAYADCGTGGALRRLCDRLGAQMLPGPHCYAVFDPSILETGEGDAFYVTDFLARQFDAFVTRPLGLDRHPELRDDYFGHYRRLVHLAQTDDPALTAKARAAADRLGLRYEERFTGLGVLAHETKRATGGATFADLSSGKARPVPCRR